MSLLRFALFFLVLAGYRSLVRLHWACSGVRRYRKGAGLNFPGNLRSHRCPERDRLQDGHLSRGPVANAARNHLAVSRR